MMITRGDKGMSVLSKGKILHIPTVAKEVFDVTGAGDTVISLYTSFKATGLDDFESSLLANIGAGVVVEKLGASTVSIEELTKAIQERNMFS
jgi:bifunctional ADP-heptose synthase (sugar kinase/adenylyltransferase)